VTPSAPPYQPKEKAMSKVLVDRELLDLLRNFTFLHDDGCAGAIRGNIDKALAAQPAEAEGVSNARLMNTLAELARRAPLRTLHTICETQRQVSTVKLERYLGPIGDTLAGYAFTLRIDFDKLSAALSAVTAERDRLQSQLAETQANDRTAMGYLHDVRQLVGGSDFPEMVRNVARMVDALPGCVELIEALSPIEGDVLRKARAAMAAKEA
jgi:hypothetical protein